MQKLYIMFCYIEDVGGGQIYVNSKVPWLEAAGWDVIVFSPLTERSDSIVPWTNLAKFAANKVEGLNKSPEFWSKKKMKAVLEQLQSKCSGEYSEIIIESHTPRSTWGVQDLAKSRAMLHIAKELEDDNFRIILQSRAGLDYFKPDLEAAKIQLASVTAMMDDIDPDNDHSPDIIHVVSYCEALYLATPDIINDSIKITRTALKEYRRLKKLGLTPDVKTDDIAERTEILETSARKILAAMEETIPDLYSPEGLYIAFVAGWLPVPELWSDSDEFIHAKCWETKMQNGGTHLVDHELLVPLETRINKCIAHNADAEYILKSKYKVLTRV